MQKTTRHFPDLRVTETSAFDGFKVVSDGGGSVPPICAGIFDNPETAQASIERARRIASEKESRDEGE